MAEEKASQRVTIEIYGATYHLRTDEPEYITELAETLDKKIKETAKDQTFYNGSNQVIILTALQILDDYTKLQKDYAELVALLDDR